MFLWVLMAEIITEDVLKIGLTGGIGCGKSTVLAMFKACGWQTLQADQIAKHYLRSQPEVQMQIKQRFGAIVFDQKGILNLEALAAIVFEDLAELDWLEARLHPLVRAHWQKALDASPAENFLVELPLLYENKLEENFDLTVCVVCPDIISNRRLELRGLAVAATQQRRRRQMMLDQKAARADCVIDNSGTVEHLQIRVHKLIASLAQARAPLSDEFSHE
jgi:dephospho-CoA kinase